MLEIGFWTLVILFVVVVVDIIESRNKKCTFQYKMQAPELPPPSDAEIMLRKYYFEPSPYMFSNEDHRLYWLSAFRD